MKTLGGALAAGAAIALVTATIVGRGATGAIVAACVFAVIVGLVLCYPTLLQDGSATAADVPAMSSMRAAILLIVSVFALVTLKAGWGASSLEALKLDPSWAWILAAALGGKAFQSFAEATGKDPPK